MIEKHFEGVILNKFGFDFSRSQEVAARDFSRFFFDRKEEGLFLLRGYAGTGKTSLVAAMVNALKSMDYKVVLLAPTGRAAKVFSAYAGHPAYTIHKRIYRQKSEVEGEGLFSLGFNGGSATLFFVDEASMIANLDGDVNFGSGCLLDDLVEFVYNGKGNRLVLIGDTAQLPPVGLDLSPALDRRGLEAAYGLSVSGADLVDVMRQAETSGILFNACRVRAMIGSGGKSPFLRTEGFPDVFRITGGELLEEMETCYGKYGEEETIVITRSNRRARRYNEGIRRSILYREDDFCAGDRVMVVRNNYFWGADYDSIDFIANGDMATVVRTGRRMEVYGCRFVRAELRIDGYGEEVDAWMLLDTLASDYPALTAEEMRRLYREVEADFADVPSRRKRAEKVRDNEFFNALQIKFAYAVTCHKAQGGQWDAVFIDFPYQGEEGADDEYWRWMYTAVTRARKRLYLVNFPDGFFASGEK